MYYDLDNITLKYIGCIAIFLFYVVKDVRRILREGRKYYSMCRCVLVLVGVCVCVCVCLCRGRISPTIAAAVESSVLSATSS